MSKIAQMPGWLKRAGGSSLDAETFECLMARRRLRGKKLESDLPAQTLVFGEIHHSHAAGTEGTQHPIMRDGAADHSARSEGAVRRMTAAIENGAID